MKVSNWSALGYNEQKCTATTTLYACTTLSAELPMKQIVCNRPQVNRAEVILTQLCAD